MSAARAATPLYEDIRALVLSARQTVARGVDLLQVYTNYEIGRRIFEQKQQGADRAEYGKELMNALATRLTDEFGYGFSRSNLKYMRQFYVSYSERVSRIGQTLSGQSSSSSQSPFSLSRSHYVFLIGLQEPECSYVLEFVGLQEHTYFCILKGGALLARLTPNQ